MFENYPIQLDTLVRNEEELIAKLDQLKGIYSNGVTQSLFANIIANLHNGQGATRDTWNSKTLTEWVNFLEPHLEGENLAEEQLELIFNYLRHQHNRIIMPNKNKFDLTIKQLYYDDNFMFEYIGLTILEL